MLGNAVINRKSQKFPFSHEGEVDLTRMQQTRRELLLLALCNERLLSE